MQQLMSIIEDKSSEYGLLALQGPVAQEVLQKLTDEPLADIKFFRFKENVNVAGHHVLFHVQDIQAKMDLKFTVHQKQLLHFGLQFLKQVKKKVLFLQVWVHVIHFVLKQDCHCMDKNCQKIFHHLKQDLALL